MPHDKQQIEDVPPKRRVRRFLESEGGRGEGIFIDAEVGESTETKVTVSNARFERIRTGLRAVSKFGSVDVTELPAGVRRRLAGRIASILVGEDDDVAVAILSTIVPTSQT